MTKNDSSPIIQQQQNLNSDDCEVERHVEEILNLPCNVREEVVRQVLAHLKNADFIRINYILRLPFNWDILQYIDHVTLLNCEAVSHDWHNAIDKNKIWQKYTRMKIKSDLVFYDMTKKSDQNLKSIMKLQLSTDAAKNALYKLSKIKKQIEDNVFKGIFSKLFINLKHSADDQTPAKNLYLYCFQYERERLVVGCRNTKIYVIEHKKSSNYHFESIKILNGHSGSVLCLQFFGDLLVSGSSDCTVRVWSLKDMQCKQIFDNQNDSILCLKFHSNILVVGCRSGFFFAWKRTGTHHFQFLKKIQGHWGAINAIGINKKYVVTAGQKGQIHIYDSEDFSLLYNMQACDSEDNFSALQVTDKFIVGGTSGGEILLANFTGRVFTKRTASAYMIRSVDFNDKIIVGASYAGEIIVWDLKKALKDEYCLLYSIRLRYKIFKIHLDEMRIIVSDAKKIITIFDFSPKNDAQLDFSKTFTDWNV